MSSHGINVDDDVHGTSTTTMLTTTTTTTNSNSTGSSSSEISGKKRKKENASSSGSKRPRNTVYRRGSRSVGTGPTKYGWRPPSSAELLESRAVNYLMMSEIFLRLRLNEAQRLMCRSVFQKYEALRRHSPLMETNQDREKNFKLNLSSTLNNVEVIPKLACTTVLMDKLSKVLDDAPEFGNERKHIDKTGKFITCDKETGMAKGYKHRGISNDGIVENARRDIGKLRNKYDAEALEKAERLVDEGLFTLGRQRKLAKGKGSYY